MFANIQIEPQKRALPLRRQTSLLQIMHGQNGGLGGVSRSQGQPFAAQVSQRLDAAGGPGNEDGCKPGVDVTHRQGTTGAACAPLNLDPRQVRVPGNVDLPRQEGFHLAIVVGKQDIVDGRPHHVEIVAHAFPDWNHARGIGHRTKHNGSSHWREPQNNGSSSRVLPTKS